MGKALVKGVARSVDDVGRCIEIRLPNLEMNNVAPLCLQRSRLHKYFEGGLGSETRHALCQAEFAGLSHEPVISLINALAQLVFLWTPRLTLRMLSRAGSHCYSLEL